MSDYKIPGEYVYDGITLCETFPTEVIDELKCLELKEGDIVVNAYPKSGERFYPRNCDRLFRPILSA